MMNKNQSLLIILFLLFSGVSFAHEGHHPADEHGEHIKKSANIEEAAIFKKINNDYVKNVRPIFQQSCFNCHSTQTQYPWYYKIPGVKQLIDHDTREAKEHIDMTNDFPFKGHGTVSEDLEAIQESIQKNTMPLWRYRVMHRDSQLKDAEKQTILKWVKESEERLKR